MAAMKQHFDKHAHRLSESERELIWRQIGNANQQERRRRVQFITAFAGAGAVVAAGLILVVMLSDRNPERRLEELSPRDLPEMGAPRTDGGDALAGRPAGQSEMRQAEESRAAAETPPAAAAPGGGNEGKAAGPTTPVDASTVAAPEAGRRDAAADRATPDHAADTPPGAASAPLTASPEVAPPTYAHEKVLVEAEAGRSWT